jgi:[ribosomal protein S5]-alanine N-acetyltransferase
MFETERLLVRHFQPSDLDDFAALCADPDVMRYMGDGTILEHSLVEHWIKVCLDKYAIRGYGTSAVFEKATGQFVGYCGVVRAPENDFDELIYAFNKSAWGKGYATEVARPMLNYVFAKSELDTIYATIHPENPASIHVAEKLGFRFDRQEVDEDGIPTSFYTIRKENI